MCDADFDNEENIRINTTEGCDLTSDAALDALRVRAARRANENNI